MKQLKMKQKKREKSKKQFFLSIFLTPFQLKELDNNTKNTNKLSCIVFKYKNYHNSHKMK